MPKPVAMSTPQAEPHTALTNVPRLQERRPSQGHTAHRGDTIDGTSRRSVCFACVRALGTVQPRRPAKIACTAFGAPLLKKNVSGLWLRAAKESLPGHWRPPFDECGRGREHRRTWHRSSGHPGHQGAVRMVPLKNKGPSMSFARRSCRGMQTRPRAPPLHAPQPRRCGGSYRKLPPGRCRSTCWMSCLGGREGMRCSKPLRWLHGEVEWAKGLALVSRLCC